MIKEQWCSGTGSADDPTQPPAPVQARAFHVHTKQQSVPVERQRQLRYHQRPFTPSDGNFKETFLESPLAELVLD